MSADTLLARLEGVKSCGPGRWKARCPAHQDRSPSLSIRHVDERTLLHCFAGCEANDVLAAVGLSLSDMFDRPLEHRKGPLRDLRHQHAAVEALKLMAHESLVAVVGAENVARGVEIGDEGRARLALAAERIRAVREGV